MLSLSLSSLSLSFTYYYTRQILSPDLAAAGAALPHNQPTTHSTS